MKASTLIRCLQKMIAAHGDLKVELDSDNGYCGGINPAGKVKLAKSDSERGDTFVIEARAE